MMQKETSINLQKSNREGVRAEELIIGIYKKKIDLQEQGIKAGRIVMPMEYYKKIRRYHLNLGEIQGKFTDYITEDEIFGIPVYIDRTEDVIVE